MTGEYGNCDRAQLQRPLQEVAAKKGFWKGIDFTRAIALRLDVRFRAAARLSSQEIAFKAHV